MQTIESSPLGDKSKGEAVHLSQLVSSSCIQWWSILLICLLVAFSENLKGEHLILTTTHNFSHICRTSLIWQVPRVQRLKPVV